MTDDHVSDLQVRLRKVRRREPITGLRKKEALDLVTEVEKLRDSAETTYPAVHAAPQKDGWKVVPSSRLWQAGRM